MANVIILPPISVKPSLANSSSKSRHGRFLDEASQLVGRNLDSVARVLYEGSSDTLVAREEPVALGTEKHSHEHDVPSAVQFY